MLSLEERRFDADILLVGLVQEVSTNCRTVTRDIVLACTSDWDSQLDVSKEARAVFLAFGLRLTLALFFLGLRPGKSGADVVAFDLGSTSDSELGVSKEALLWMAVAA